MTVEVEDEGGADLAWSIAGSKEMDTTLHQHQYIW